MVRRRSYAAALGAVGILAACGGGQSGGEAAQRQSPQASKSAVPTERLCNMRGADLQVNPGWCSGKTLASGSGVRGLPQPLEPHYSILDFGGVAGGPALANQAAINSAIDAAAAAGGGTVVIPEGEFKTYTVRLKSNVGIHLASPKSVLRAAVQGTGANQDGGFYDAPEVNLFVGLQDHGHSHWANSLIYGVDVENVMISGPGLIDGSYVNASGVTVNVLSGNDPGEVSNRPNAGVAGGANKAIALKNSRNIVFRDFSIKNGGHFGIIGTGVVGWTVDGITVDTNRDAFNIDASQDVTVRNSTFNSLTDDAIVLKASFGLGKYMATQNVLIENCVVSGYDAGSVIDKVYSTNKAVATDRDGPTARIKFGTEGTTGFNTVTVRNVTFDRSRGFALESVDGAELRDVEMFNVKMTNVSSSPIFIRLGDRGRIPVTGNSASQSVSPSDTVRLDDRNWVLPSLVDLYGSFPTIRYVPSYTKNRSVAIGGQTATFSIVNPDAPTRLNLFAPDPSNPLMANAVGGPVAKVRNIRISDVTITDADPRYPILLAGLVDNPIENVHISNVSVEFRGGLKMEHAIEQRQLDQNYSYVPYLAAPANQSLPWLVNTFFSKSEALLPRVSWNPALGGGTGGWEADPYNVPEMPREYPEPSLFGVLPAYGIYARHVTGLRVEDVSVKYLVEDERPAVVLDSVTSSSFSRFTAPTKAGTPAFVKVTNTRKRPPVTEYVKDAPYKTTTVVGVSTPEGMPVQEVTVNRPAPGTPPDTLYAYPTAPSVGTPYAHAVANAQYPLPLTVHRPFFDAIPDQQIAAGKQVTFVVSGRVFGTGLPLAYRATVLPAGATFDALTRQFSWTPLPSQQGMHRIELELDDGVLPVKKGVSITVTPPAKGQS